LLILQDLPALAGPAVALCTNFARILSVPLLQDGVWKGQRILPEGYVKFASSLAPAWKADGRPIYGGLFWINGDGKFPVPKEAYFMRGAGGQFTLIIPSHNVVVVRLGHFKGESAGEASLRRSLALLMDAVPPLR
jgi:CubicO group peptidase (beta-lactamase class C family)